jgi:hypothetical protein
MHELFRGIGHGRRWGRSRDMGARAQDTCSDARLVRKNITAPAAGEADD